ncbi:tellurite resistance protein [Ruegeria lacuscaerulensis ITI-1157]|nr:tellurite resistance protein [Ruegeria lacuscaerulensis ITI-1157]SHI62829.1 nudix-type nucleoside diphosphatase, YffH/AdpP family [Ruegeria lacuscaerulensis ITI-1157]
MTNLFFYGTLRFAPLLELVLGRSTDDLRAEHAVLSDYAVRTVEGQPFPMIVEEPGAVAQGLLVRDLGEEDLARLAYYESGFDYDLIPRNVEPDGRPAEPALVFFPEPGAWVPGSPWSLEDWISEWGEMTLLAAGEVMGYYGKVGPDRIAGSFPAIRRRAWARLAARQRRAGAAHDTCKDVIVHRHTRAYVDYFGMEELELQHRQFDGTMGPVLHRSALMQGSAVVVLPYDPKRDRVLLVEQFRAPVFLIDDPEPWMWEPVAGMIDPGETPEQAAYREAEEEAHIRLSGLEYAGGAYSSSGSSTEYVHLFIGLGDLTRTISNGGLASEGEDIRSQILSYEAFMDLVDQHGFKDLPLLTLAHWLARHRDRLRE